MERRSKVLWSVFVGINDVAIFEIKNSREFLYTEMHNYHGLLNTLREDFGAKDFLLLNVPDTARTPRFVGLDSKDKALLQSKILGWNKLLADLATRYLTQNADAVSFPRQSKYFLVSWSSQANAV